MPSIEVVSTFIASMARQHETVQRPIRAVLFTCAPTCMIQI